MQQNGMGGGMKYGIMNGLFPSAEAFETLAREYGTSSEAFGGAEAVAGTNPTAGR